MAAVREKSMARADAAQVHSVIDSRVHSTERAKVSSIANSPFKDAIHIGSTGIQVYLRTADDRVSQRIAPTADADIVASQAEVQRIAENLAAQIIYNPLIARTITKMGSRVRQETEYEPFELIHLVSPHGPTNEFYKSVDIFTDRTSVGVIPVTAEVLTSGFNSVTIGEADVRVAKPFFLIATQLNPFARTDARSDRMLFVMVQAYQNMHAKGFEAEVAKAISYIGMGEQRAQELVATDPALRIRVEFSEYPKLVRQVGTLMGNQLKPKILTISRQLGLSAADAKAIRETVADHFSGYKPTTDMVPLLRN